MVITFRIRRVLKELAPPLLIKVLRRCAGAGIAFRGQYASWQDALSHSRGYADASILDKVMTAALKVRAGEAAGERDSVVLKRAEPSFPVLAALLRAALENDGRLDVLDFGGSLGSSYYACRRFLAPVRALRWGIVEQPHFVAAGRQHFENCELKFYPSMAECLAVQTPHVALLSSVIQYIPDPHGQLLAMAGCGFRYIVLDRTPCRNGESDALTVQVVPPDIYDASYPSWIFGEEALCRPLLDRYTLLTDFPSPEGAIESGDLTARYKGFILERLPACSC